MEMKKCKECGKMFMPKSMRQQYCDALHYRPCPVCGKLVEAKYLSDPARCCSNECKKQLASKTRSAVVIPAKEVLESKPAIATPATAAELADMPIDAADGQLAEYKGPKVGNWIPGHRYVIRIDKNPKDYGQYKIYGSKDVTLDQVMKLFMPLSSQNSIDRYFIIAG